MFKTRLIVWGQVLLVRIGLGVFGILLMFTLSVIIPLAILLAALIPSDWCETCFRLGDPNSREGDGS